MFEVRIASWIYKPATVSIKALSSEKNREIIFFYAKWKLLKAIINAMGE
jgi:hypothetical protein